MKEKEQVKELLKTNNFSEEELDLITHFYLHSDIYKRISLDNLNDKELLEKKARLEEIYINLIKKEQEKIREYENIKKMIVMVSYAEILDIENIIFELPIEKSLRIFPNLDTFYLLYTSGTKKDFENIKNKLKKLFEKRNLNNVNIIGKEIENNLESIYPYLKKLAREGNISKNDTIIDLTTGMKISGIALYKLAVERGIKIINWKEELLSLQTQKNKNIRIPFSICLEVLKEPIRESSKNYENINTALKNKEYSLVANIFETIGDDDKAFLFKNIDMIFNLESLFSFDPEYFFNELRDIVKRILSYKNYTADTKMKMKDFLCFISVLAFYEENDDTFDEEDIGEESWRNILIKIFGFDVNSDIDNMINCCYDSDALFDKNNIFDYLVLSVLNDKFMITDNKNTNKILIEFISKFINIKSNSLKNELNTFFNKEICKDLNKALNLEKAFKMDVQKTIYIKNGILTIEKFNLVIDLKKYKNKSKYFMNLNNNNFKSINGKLIIKTLESPNYKLSRNDFEYIISKSDNDRILYKINDEAIKNLNEIIACELQNIDEKQEDFLIIDFKGNKKEIGHYPIIINEKFFI